MCNRRSVFCKRLASIFRCNSSYLEDTAKVKKFNAAARNYKHEKMVVVTEWEEFGSHVSFFLSVIFLVHLDARSCE